MEFLLFFLFMFVGLPCLFALIGWIKKNRKEAKKYKKLKPRLDKLDYAEKMLVSNQKEWEKMENVKQIQEVARAQRSLIWAFFGVFAYWLALSRLVSPAISLILFVAVLIELFLVFQLARSLKFNVIQCILFLIAVIIPIWWINLICLLILSHKATKFLKNAGVKVGLMGVKPTGLPGAESD